MKPQLPKSNPKRALTPRAGLAGLAASALILAACSSSDEASSTETSAAAGNTVADTAVTDTVVAETGSSDGSESSDAASGSSQAATTVRDSGLTVTVQSAGDVVVHTLTAPEAVFANSTHLIETDNTLVAIDTQFLLPNASDMRAYADELGKPIDRVYITHEHPDHFLGSEAFADVPVFALPEVNDLIEEIGQAEVDEKQGEFGTEAIASSFVVPEAVEPGEVEIDGQTFVLERVVDAEAKNQLVVRVPDAGVVATGDIVYHDVHLVLAGNPTTWTAALEGLQSTADEYPIVLPGHGLPADPSVYEANIEWLATADDLLGTAETGEEFKQGMVDAYPDYGMVPAIDLVLPLLYPDSANATQDASVESVGDAGDESLPERAGPRRETTGSVPHVQIDAVPVPAVDAELRRRAFLLPGIEDEASPRSLPGARGLIFADDVELLRPEVSGGSREFAHIHPDGSLHVWMPVNRAIEVDDKKWGELHPWVDRDDFWDGVVMIYTPESPEELEVTMQLLVDAYNYSTGASVTADDLV